MKSNKYLFFSGFRKSLFLVVCACLLGISFPGCKPKPKYIQRKPVIYLYPQQKEQVSVELKQNGTFTVTEPQYENGWKVIAEPDGKITNLHDGKIYPYLFWEAATSVDYSLNEGFIVEGNRTKQFLDSILPILGLNKNEKTEFISYWLPVMEKNSFNKIRFAGEDYTKNAELIISPKPDVLTRVFMVFKKCEASEKISPQKIVPAKRRKGFTVIEWGGMNLDENSGDNSVV